MIFKVCLAILGHYLLKSIEFQLNLTDSKHEDIFLYKIRKITLSLNILKNIDIYHLHI